MARNYVLVAMVAAVLALGGLVPGPAAAHAVLLESSPPPKAEVLGSKVEFNLRYNSRVDAKRSRLSLQSPNGTRNLEVRQGKSEAELSARAEGLSPGQHVLHWDVLSVDGHVSRGVLPFLTFEK